MTALAVRQGTPEWLDARRATIGSSDIPVIVGESTYKSAYTLAAEKLGLIEPVYDEATRELMDIGHLMQPVLLQIYERKTGRKPKGSTGWRTHPQIPWATASLDGTAPVRRVVEAKWSNAARWRSGERVPGDVNIQVQWQLFVVGWDVADVVVMERGVPRVEEIERDDALIDDLTYFAREFYLRLERGELPPLEGSTSTRATIVAMHRDGPLLPQTAELVEIVDQYRAAKSAVKEAEAVEGTVGNALRSVLGESAGIDGLCTFRKNADSTRTNWPAVAKAYRLLIEEAGIATDLDAIESIHSETSDGPWVLRLLKEKP